MSRQVFHSTRANQNRQGRTPGFAAVLRFVTLCCNSLPLAGSSHGRAAPLTAISRAKRREYARVPHPTREHATHSYFEIASSAIPLVRGPMNPIAAITTTIAPAMKANTPNVPKPFSTAAITNDEKIAEKRLHE
ncbi:hypothetical protein GEM_3213 [Burkholderia cepacia GG4]|uniref:Uncharacterized protein n=1 Tax=Burkholderia cepacia GG4 TaxID=1009846 RepID=A0A9W3PAJ6_BURCE|nr:hypothetical protein GEM_3213 [Burkholderia cepacia GG4]